MSFNFKDLGEQGPLSPEDLMDQDKIKAIKVLDEAIKACVEHGFIIGLVAVDNNCKLVNPENKHKMGSILVEIKANEDSFSELGEDKIRELVTKGIEVYNEKSIPIQVLDNPYDFS